MKSESIIYVCVYICYIRLIRREEFYMCAYTYNYLFGDIIKTELSIGKTKQKIVIANFQYQKVGNRKRKHRKERGVKSRAGLKRNLRRRLTIHCKKGKEGNAWKALDRQHFFTTLSCYCYSNIKPHYVSN